MQSIRKTRLCLICFALTMLVISALAVSASAAVTTNSIQIGQKKIAYYTRGQGPPLLMIMGFGGTMSEWDPALLERLETRYKLILFDNRGIGLSQGLGRSPLTIGKMAEDSSRLLSALGIRRANVLGWSMGSYIAQELVARHPKQVRRLILVGADPGGTHAIQASQSIQKQLNNPNATPQQFVDLIFPRNPAGRAAGSAYLSRIGDAAAAGTIPLDFSTPAKTINAQVAAENRWYESNKNFRRLRHIRKPTLIVDGKLDILVPAQNSRIIARRMPDSRLWLYNNAGHASFFQHHQSFSHLMFAFLG